MPQALVSHGYHIGDPAVGAADHNKLIQTGNRAYMELFDQYMNTKAELDALKKMCEANVQKSTDLQVDIKTEYTKNIAATELEKEDYPKIRFWTEKSWSDAMKDKDAMDVDADETGTGDKKVKYLFVQMESGKVIDKETEKKINAVARSIFASLLQSRKAKESFSKLDVKARDFYDDEMVKHFPYLALCKEKWKLQRIGTIIYPSFFRSHKEEILACGEEKGTTEASVEGSSSESKKRRSNAQSKPGRKKQKTAEASGSSSQESSGAVSGHSSSVQGVSDTTAVRSITSPPTRTSSEALSPSSPSTSISEMGNQAGPNVAMPVHLGGLNEGPATTDPPPSPPTLSSIGSTPQASPPVSFAPPGRIDIDGASNTSTANAVNATPPLSPPDAQAGHGASSCGLNEGPDFAGPLPSPPSLSSSSIGAIPLSPRSTQGGVDGAANKCASNSVGATPPGAQACAQDSGGLNEGPTTTDPPPSPPSLSSKGSTPKVSPPVSSAPPGRIDIDGASNTSTANAVNATPPLSPPDAQAGHGALSCLGTPQGQTHSSLNGAGNAPVPASVEPAPSPPGPPSGCSTQSPSSNLNIITDGIDGTANIPASNATSAPSSSPGRLQVVSHVSESSLAGAGGLTSPPALDELSAGLRKVDEAAQVPSSSSLNPSVPLSAPDVSVTQESVSSPPVDEERSSQLVINGTENPRGPNLRKGDIFDLQASRTSARNPLLDVTFKPLEDNTKSLIEDEDSSKTKEATEADADFSNKENARPSKKGKAVKETSVFRPSKTSTTARNLFGLDYVKEHGIRSEERVGEGQEVVLGSARHGTNVHSILGVGDFVVGKVERKYSKQRSGRIPSDMSRIEYARECEDKEKKLGVLPTYDSVI
ncbi:hypothetical protein SCHPADRAFT_989748 [Schizopora paradoxa]|uniref:Uncharacterized protein n=1 Tax=Schizopora paradoxa TaxID=27342 RepID=A0A0H2QY84_9AGAM|nr:hypothetical protein SCHPADRAFT_989748 [Schizopora paradoxa]